MTYETNKQTDKRTEIAALNLLVWGERERAPIITALSCNLLSHIINPVVMQLLRFSVIILFIQYLLGVLYAYYNTSLRLYIPRYSI